MQLNPVLAPVLRGLQSGTELDCLALWLLWQMGFEQLDASQDTHRAAWAGWLREQPAQNPGSWDEATLQLLPSAVRGTIVAQQHTLTQRVSSLQTKLAQVSGFTPVQSALTKIPAILSAHTVQIPGIGLCLAPILHLVVPWQVRQFRISRDEISGNILTVAAAKLEPNSRIAPAK